MEEAHHIAQAAASLGDRYADERRVLEQILCTEPDIDRRRAAQRRFIEITESEGTAA